MADSSPLVGLLERTAQILELVGELARGIWENELSPGEENRRRVASAWNALLPAIVEIGKSLPPEPSPLADWIREVGRVSRWFDDVIHQHGLTDALFRYNCDGFVRVAEEGRALFKDLAVKRDSFEFVDEPNAGDAANGALSLLDRFPATPVGHVGFLEFVRDEVHNAAEVKRQQIVRRYSGDTLASMVSGIKWAEAGQRTSMLSELPADAVEQVACVLRRELAVGTVEQTDDLLKPAVRALRDALEGADNATTAKLADDTNKARPDEKHAETAKPTTPTRTSARRPPEIALIAWRLRDLSGITNQTQIAAKMTKEGISATQGQVSRWLKQVDDYMKAGNVLPTIPPPTFQPQSIDPEIIDMGERQDGRTPRQRDRGDTENR